MRVAETATLIGLVFLALIIVLPAAWFRRVEWIVLAYVALAAVAMAFAIVAAYSKGGVAVSGRLIVIAAINVIGVLGVGFVFFTFRMSAP